MQRVTDISVSTWFTVSLTSTGRGWNSRRCNSERMLRIAASARKSSLRMSARISDFLQWWLLCL
jgi:hypothetical protein